MVSPAMSVGQVWLGPSTRDPYVVSRVHRDTGLVDMVSAKHAAKGLVNPRLETTVTREWTKLPDVRQGQRWSKGSVVVTITAVDLSTMKVHTSAQGTVDLFDWHQAGWVPIEPSFFDQVKELAACGEKPKCQIEEYDTPGVMACHFHDVLWMIQDQPTCPFAGQMAHTGDHVRILTSNPHDFEACYEAEPRDGSALAHLATMGQTVAMVLSAKALRHLATIGKACDGIDGVSNPTSERFALLELD